MTAYTPTGGANLIAQEGGALTNRLAVALGQKCLAIVQAGNPSAEDLARITNITANPIGYANRALFAIVAAANPANPGTDTAPAAPTDAELIATVNALWPLGASVGL